MAEKRKAKKQTETGSDDTEKTKTYDLSSSQDLIDLLKTGDEKLAKQEYARYFDLLAKKYELGEYEIILLFDDVFSINQYHANRIYNSISELKEPKNILMVLLSDGGKIEPAYLISKICKRFKKEKFVVSIPRRAKSAATLISLGADEIHMGLLSELGPIDPQFRGFPALGFSNALQRLAELSCQYPGSSELFAKYLKENLDLRDLGYFERVNESAVQYAERLLEDRNLINEINLADHFTNHYKDHSFVIDVDEARKLLGDQVIKEDTPEYKFGNEIFQTLDFSNFIARVFAKKTIRCLGNTKNAFEFDNVDDENVTSGSTGRS